MKDRTKFKNLLPNIVVEHEHGETVPDNGNIQHPLRDMVVAVAANNPTLTFVTRDSNVNGDGSLNCYKFSVYQGDELLGTVRRKYRGSDDNYVVVLDCTRIDDKRQRGANTLTKDPKRAIKEFHRHFYIKTDEEIMEEHYYAIGSHMHGDHNTSERELTETYEYLMDYLKDYIFKKWNKIKLVALAEGASSSKVDLYSEQVAQFRLTKEIFKQHESNKSVVVVVHGEHYIVQRTTFQAYHRSTMPVITFEGTAPPAIRRGVGLLKLVEDKTFIKDVGYRFTETKFLLVGDEVCQLVPKKQ